MTTLANIETGAILGADVTVVGMATALELSGDVYAVENFIAKLIYAVNKYENTLVDPTTAAKTNASWGVNGSGIASFSVKGLCNFDGGAQVLVSPSLITGVRRKHPIRKRKICSVIGWVLVALDAPIRQITTIKPFVLFHHRIYKPNIYLLALCTT
jgi:hypothetical protein